MAKTTFASLKLKNLDDKKNINFNNSEIEISQYISISDKYDLISITLQKALEDNNYNEVLLDMYFHLNLIYLYTNIQFTEKQRENEFKIYDALKCSGLLNLILENIPEEEYNVCYDYLEKEAKKRTKMMRSAIGLVQSIITDLPKQAQAAADILENFDKTKYQNVINFAKAANGGREI